MGKKRTFVSLHYEDSISLLTEPNREFIRKGKLQDIDTDKYRGERAEQNRQQTEVSNYRNDSTS